MQTMQRTVSEEEFFVCLGQLNNINFGPSLVENIPGVASITADALSRLNQPGSESVVPPMLKNVPMHECASRNRDGQADGGLP